METNKYQVLSYFKYDIEKLLDEFNNYYSIKQVRMPNHFRTIFLYFSNLSEIGLQSLIHSQFDVKNAKQITKVLPSYPNRLTSKELRQNMSQLQMNPVHYEGLFTFSYYFYEIFLNYVKNNQAKPLLHLGSQMPIIENNIQLLKETIKGSQSMKPFN
jgi:hypothetical protein